MPRSHCTRETVKAEAEQFRIANERIAAAVRPLDVDVAAPVRFMCECADSTCFGSNELTLEEFDRQRVTGAPIIGPNCLELGGPGT